MTKRRRSYVPAVERRYLNSGLKRLGYRSYEAYLHSAHWAATRRRFVRKRCERCDGAGRLHLHHVTYRRLGAELAGDFCTLCPRCHAGVHDAARATKSRAAQHGAGRPEAPPRHQSRRTRRKRKPPSAVLALRSELDLALDLALDKDPF